MNFVFQIALSLICNRPKFRLSHRMTKCTKRTNVPDVPKMYQNHNESRVDVSYGCCWFLISSMMEFPTRLLFIPVSLLTLITKKSNSMSWISCTVRLRINYHTSEHQSHHMIHMTRNTCKNIYITHDVYIE